MDIQDITKLLLHLRTRRKLFSHALMVLLLLEESLVYFSDFSYNIIAYFYAEICTIYQIYILLKFKAEVKTPAKIRSENKSRAQQVANRLKVATRSDGKANKNYRDRRELTKTKTGRTSRKIMSRHRF